MHARCHVTLNREAFAAIIKQLPTRKGPMRKRGVRCAVPLDVLIYSAGTTLVIEGPALAKSLPMTGAWDTCISVSARTLALIGSTLKTGDQITLTSIEGALVLDAGAYVIPAKAASRPV